MNKNIVRAMEYAALAHKDHLRSGPEKIPYISHVAAVGTILANNNFPEDIIVAGILHDTVEDTDTTIDDILNEFGPQVAQLVRDVTEDKSLPHIECKIGYCEHLRIASADAAAISAADWIANINSAVIKNGPGSTFPPGYSDEKKAEMKSVYQLRLDVLTEKLGADHYFVTELNQLLAETLK